MKHKLRGWNAIESELRQQGLSKVEINKARESFREGIGILSDLFLRHFYVEKK